MDNSYVVINNKGTDSQWKWMNFKSPKREWKKNTQRKTALAIEYFSYLCEIWRQKTNKNRWNFPFECFENVLILKSQSWSPFQRQIKNYFCKPQQRIWLTKFRWLSKTFSLQFCSTSKIISLDRDWKPRKQWEHPVQEAEAPATFFQYIFNMKKEKDLFNIQVF